LRTERYAVELGYQWAHDNPPKWFGITPAKIRNVMNTTINVGKYKIISNNMMCPVDGDV
jgi:hypothetical protein